MKGRINIWDALAWIALFWIFAWLVLKVFGDINTPSWLEYSPLFAAVYSAGWAMSKLETVSSDVKELKKFRYTTINEINSIKTNCIKNHK